MSDNHPIQVSRSQEPETRTMLRRLMKECAGIMALAGEAIKESVGYTNWLIFDDRIREAGALLEALAGVSEAAGASPVHTHDFAYYEVCKVCGKTDAAIAGCHHCTDTESVKNGRCWWCLRVVEVPAKVGAVPPPGETPKVICLCGSTRFIEQFATLTWLLEREGYIVLGCTLLPTWFCQVPSHFGDATGTKVQCDELHKRKIDRADEVLVIDIGGYTGESTRSEIAYAEATGKPVRYLSANRELLSAALPARHGEAPTGPVVIGEGDGAWIATSGLEAPAGPKEAVAEEPKRLCPECDTATRDGYCWTCHERMYRPKAAKKVKDWTKR